jgi:F0F1-type ATP synthase alpha subunit
VLVENSIASSSLRFRQSMRFPSLTVAAFALLHLPICSHAWATLPVSSHRKGSIALASRRRYTNCIPKSKLAVTASISPAPEVIAEGAIVSAFQGGLVAVRLNEGLFIPDSTYSPPDMVGISAEATAAAAGAAAKSDLSTTYDMQGRKVILADGSQGVVVAHRPPIVFVYSHNGVEADTDGLVQVYKEMSSISISPDQTVVDCFGTPQFDETATTHIKTEDIMKRDMFAPIPKVAEIALINNPVLTGITMFDTLAPIGRGQNMLMIGHDLKDMQGYALDFLQTQVTHGKNVKCIYATTSDRDGILERVKARNIDKDVHIVVPVAFNGVKADASKAAEAVASASTACSIGEMYALQKGMHAIVVIDTLDSHKLLWDTTTRVLVDVYGVDSVVKSDRDGGASSEMRGFFSSLVQRAGQYKETKGGGSITLLLMHTIPSMSSEADGDTVFEASAFEQSPQKVRERIRLLTSKNVPLTAANLRKISIPLPTEGKRLYVLQHVDDLMSMTDGQIWLDERLESAGQHPPMDPQRSVTRIGIGADTTSRADAPALRRIAERLRLELSQASSMDGAEQTVASVNQIRRQKALLLAMHQESGLGGRRLSESCVALLAAWSGKLDNAVDSGALAGTEKGVEVMKGLLEHANSSIADVMASIDEDLDFDEDARTKLESAMDAYFAK